MFRRPAQERRSLSVVTHEGAGRALTHCGERERHHPSREGKLSGPVAVFAIPELIPRHGRGPLVLPRRIRPSGRP
jgi:hypothetical protein